MNDLFEGALDGDVDPVEGLAPGVAFGPYRIVRLLGKGGMGAVYEATHTLLHKRVALKTLHAELARDSQARQRFVREGQAASKLDHPHVVSVSDVGVHDGIPYLVMDLMTGEDLGAVLDRESMLSVERTVEVMVPVCVAVEAAHRAGIIHRDLKPDNIFLAQNALGQMVPTVLDFGISKLIDVPASHGLTGSAAFMGTPFYMSPEQAMGARDVEAHSDQYALGVILYECVAGRRPFRGESLFEILREINDGTFPLPRTLRTDLPERFEAMILRAMSPAGRDRFPSCEALAQELLVFGDAKTRRMWGPNLGMPSDVPPMIIPSRASGVPSRPSRVDTLSDTAGEIEKSHGISRNARSRSALVGAGAVAVLTLGTVAWVLHGHHDPSPHAAARTVPAAQGPVPTPDIAPAVPVPLSARAVTPVTPMVAPAPTPAAQRASAAPGIAVTPSATTQHHGAHRPQPQRVNQAGEGCQQLPNGAFDCS